MVWPPTEGRVFGLTMIMVERCHPEWEGGSVSCFCRRGPLRLRFSALRTGPSTRLRTGTSTPLCCVQDDRGPFDVAQDRPFDSAQDRLASLGGKIIGSGKEDEKTLPGKECAREETQGIEYWE